jgi:hypothetical protein
MKMMVMTFAMLGLFLGGCQSNGSFDWRGLPREHYYIGGGYDIDYTARTAGTLYIVEKRTNKLVGTKTMSAGERHQGKMDLDHKALGIDASRMRFAFYFIPAY